MTESSAIPTDEFAAPDVPRLVVRTTELDPDVHAGLDLLQTLPAEEATAWVRRGEGLVGHGEAARLDVAGPDRFAIAVRWWDKLAESAAVRDEIGEPGTGLVGFGSFAFADDPGHSALVVPRVVLGRRGDRRWLTTISVEPALPTVPSLPSLFGTPPPPERPQGVVFADGALTGAQWASAVADAVRRIDAGDLDKVVLARDLLAVAEKPVDFRWPLARIARDYPACWTYAVRGLIGATPEMLVRLENGLVTSRVLAGTIRRTNDDARDLALAASLARSSKDLEEHEYAVRSVADSLAPHCTSMNVPESPFVLHLPNVMHLATDLAGVLADGSSALELAAALHPSAAVCGTPTPVALSLIAELEHMDRGRYAGPVGWVDAAGNGEWGIALRCAQVDSEDPRRLRLYAGCGIVADSVPESELAEAQAKLVPVRDALTPDPNDTSASAPALDQP
ncbi:menaquinone-specific isochorismate synthase [Actinopolymorpha cephalotaxi]|uniref:isochorismate synthase n=1 Tax=Actinopolymorpha cephalotaxi TaxID=504797 RepID=A0A1I2NJB5_9ACTN|nr:isochorismate synthase [Actinopolymorpha cephalotaxi]NYH85481.1 menaquinone-specific isochorismate synthase [Actinopolymorpha cephalotaxi]SFG03984.1 menaquinone-specific isochorismate synthase [Actinopolymorpha cephalotaxi]